MKLTDLLASIAVLAILGGIALPRLAAAKRHVESTLARVLTQHNERIDYLASGCLEDPKGHHTTEKDVDDSVRYFTNLDLR